MEIFKPAERNWSDPFQHTGQHTVPLVWLEDGLTHSSSQCQSESELRRWRRETQARTNGPCWSASVGPPRWATSASDGPYHRGTEPLSPGRWRTSFFKTCICTLTSTPSQQLRDRTQKPVQSYVQVSLVDLVDDQKMSRQQLLKQEHRPTFQRLWENRVVGVGACLTGDVPRLNTHTHTHTFNTVLWGKSAPRTCSGVSPCPSPDPPNPPGSSSVLGWPEPGECRSAGSPPVVNKRRRNRS